jgi:hypothetical protein
VQSFIGPLVIILILLKARHCICLRNALKFQCHLSTMFVYLVNLKVIRHCNINHFIYDTYFYSLVDVTVLCALVKNLTVRRERSDR